MGKFKKMTTCVLAAGMLAVSPNVMAEDRWVVCPKTGLKICPKTGEIKGSVLVERTRRLTNVTSLTHINLEHQQEFGNTALTASIGGVLSRENDIVPHSAHFDMGTKTEINRNLGVSSNLGMFAFPAHGVANVNAKVVGTAGVNIGNVGRIDLNAGVLAQGRVGRRDVEGTFLDRDLDPISPIVPIVNVDASFRHRRHEVRLRAGNFASRNKMPLTERSEAVVNPNFGPSIKGEYRYSLPVFGKGANLEVGAFALKTDPTRFTGNNRPYIVPSTQVGLRANVRLNSRSQNTRVNVGRTHHRGTTSRTETFIYVPGKGEQ